ncbi:M48 family metallopeptidase [Cucumibacter marinus]|uniref:M48 family metallopeptidase n=1 Tax=Cucumibacter marinus TaxID=1121252 RepID=UPI00040FA49A|nr:M48 family metallopeptidase [Cucumibacter marinus]
MAVVEARYFDGETARPQPVTVTVTGSSAESGFLTIADPATGREIGRWPRSSLRPAAEARNCVVIASSDARNANARIAVHGFEQVQSFRQALPTLRRASHVDRFEQLRFLVVSTMALVVVIGAFIFGVPLIARQIVAVIPPEFEADLGDRVLEQVETVFGAEGRGLVQCDPDPNSPANLAIARFVDRVLEDVDTPFDVRVSVIRSPIQNAFALPGGRIFYFSALLKASDDPDAFAGVLAHEIGHVVERHGMENAVATAGSGLLVALVLGDATGLSVGAVVGQALIDSRFSREAERSADNFAIAAADRLGFGLEPMGDMLVDVAGGGDAERALSLLSSHPLTDERRALFASFSDGGEPAFTAKGWKAIRRMCSE